MDANPAFSDLLRQHRTQLGLSQQALAAVVAASRSLIKEIERGTARPNPELAEVLAAYFALTGPARDAFLALARAPLPDLLALDRPVVARGRPRLPPAPSALRGRWPVAPTVLIPRVAETAQVVDILSAPGVRLVTLTGPPGIGKTRLAVAVATALTAAYPAGVCFVPLAALTDPALVLPALVAALGLPASGLPAPEVRLAEALGADRHLLVLDNFEQVLGAAAALSALLAAAPGLHLLVTSREVLHLYGEHEYPVPPLAVPEAHAGLPFDALADYAAVVLFVQRAQAVTPDFVLTDANAAAVAALCAHLDGLPLAIELAAARSKLFSPAALLARMGNCLALLTGGPRDLPARQQTLRGAIAWSYDLLTPAERTVFRRLAVFQGGCSEAAAAAMVSEEAAPLDVLAALTSLVDKSLLQREETSDTLGLRFGLLETIRAYAWEQLQAQGEVAEIQRRHALYYIHLAETPTLLADGSIALTWLQHLAQEQDNLRAVLAWTATQSDRDWGARLSTAVWESGLGTMIGAYWVAHWLQP